jgi:uncharacterized protein YbjQ (UPF0145 family)
MFVIADNLNVRNKSYMDAVKKKDGKAIEAMAKELATKGADMINVQVSMDGTTWGQPVAEGRGTGTRTVIAFILFDEIKRYGVLSQQRP